MPSAASPRATSASAARTLSAIANFGSAACQAPSFSSAALAYLPTGTDLTSPVAILPSPASLARSKPGPMLTLSILESFGAISTMAVAEQIDPGRLVDGLLADRIIHPVGVGGDEYIGRRALFDLFCERRACGIARDDLDAGLGGIGGVDVVERVLHRGRGEHREGLVLRSGGRIGRSAQDDEGGKNSGKTMHDGAPCVFAARACARANQALVESGMRQAEAPFR